MLSSVRLICLHISVKSVMRFAWDADKAATNLTNHGVSFEEAKEVFDDEVAASRSATLTLTRRKRRHKPKSPEALH
jgi:hypothetical protein